MSTSFEFVAPDHFTAGAVGPPGQRVFYLQSREKGTLITLKSEKEQVRALAQYPSATTRRATASWSSPTSYRKKRKAARRRRPAC